MKTLGIGMPSQPTLTNLPAPNWSIYLFIF